MIALLLAEGFEEVEAVTPADFLRRAGLDVKMVGIGGRRIEGAHGIFFETDLTIEDINEDPEAVIVPGGMPGAENVADNEKALSIIRKVNDNGGVVAAICAAPAVVLQKAGILNGKRVTCYPGFQDKFQNCYFKKEKVVIDGNIVTSRGPGTAAEFSIKLIEKLLDKQKAEEIRKKTLQR